MGNLRKIEMLVKVKPDGMLRGTCVVNGVKATAKAKTMVFLELSMLKSLKADHNINYIEFIIKKT